MLQQRRPTLWIWTALLAVVVGVLAGNAAEAVTYTLFGNAKFFNGFALRRVVPGSGTVTGPASSLGSIMIPGGRFATIGTSFQFFAGAPSFAQNASTFSEVQTASHTLTVGGGPGGFEFCPPIGNPLNPACNEVAGLAGYLGFSGFVDYDPGVNQFGGTFRVARKVQTVTSARIATGPSQFAHQREIRGALPAQAGGPTSFRSPDFVPTTTQVPLPGVLIANPRRADWAPGLPYRSQYFQASPGVVTISPMLAPGEGWIQSPGPPGTAPPFTPLPSTTTGFAFTTGIARQVQVNTLGAVSAFTVTGGNFRGPDGQGNIVLVAGGIAQNRASRNTAVFAEIKLGLVDTTLPEPTTSFGVAAGLGLLVVLWSVRRRSACSLGSLGSRA